MMFSPFKYSHTLLAHKRLAFVFTSQSRSFEKLVKIGNVSAAISKPKNPLLVPINYLPKSPSKTTLEHLQWIMKKDILGQDVFLIGLPGPSRARVILQYLELMQREVEYVVLTRDTTENDLKQRREIVDGTAHFVDQSAVTAAVEGRFLILDGIEKAERNVLPILNNLLENREMQLEDGRFLLGHERYDKLLLKHTQEELDALKLVRISENFRVVALGLPVPPFKGNPLDPPFRSRFQARHVQSSYEDQVLAFSNSERKIDESSFKSFLSACYALISPEAANLGLLKFPVENLSSVIKILAEVPSVSRELLIRWMYPYNIILSKESQKSVKGILETFSILHEQPKTDFKVTEKRDSSHPYLTHSLEISTPKNVVECDIIGHKTNSKHSLNFVPNSYHNRMLAEMLQTHISHDFCIIGEKGSGKTMLVRKFAALLNYPIEMIMLYKDMTARDFLQQRVTDESGNTLWKSSPIVEAALAGKLLVLDGLHRLHSSIFSILQRLIHNRELQLYDGTRLISHDQYDTLKKTYELSDSDMEANKILPVHPAFRIIGLAEPPKLQNSKDQWITPEIMSMFLFHTIRPLSLKEEAMVINSLVGKMDDKFNSVLTFAHALRNSADDALQSVSASFSTRQLVRIARRLHNFPEENVYNLVTQACVMSFLPQLTKKAVENVLENCDIKSVKGSAPKEIFVADDMLHVGSTTAPLFKPGSSEVKVPEILFYNSPEHLQVMEAMLQDFLLGEHLLLIGNQGVGKNKITDRFLQLLNRPREYIQLHRDTTVQSLTQQPTVRDGKIMYEDSPLLKAVQNGHVLVVDEADKAPTHVTSVLKALVESGEMILSDGRRIIHHSDQRPSDDKRVVMHPDFRMIVLANRPGFPFLGNDFFATLGDIFSCHAVDNPSLESEMSMLRQYGPNVPEYVLDKLAKFFGELRSMSDAGLISYPYSTREVVNIVKHIDKFPNEGISFVLKNVFDFDSFSSELKETLNNLFEKYGKQSLQNSFLEWKKLAGVDREQLNLEYVNKNLASKPKHGKVDPTGAPHVGGNTWAGGTGGRDTAGFGGKGGPYRLDAGHDVYQVSDQEKEAVPLEVREAAREMAMKVYKEKLKEIEMSDYDAEMYEKFFNSVKKEVNLLRVILDSLQAKSKERLWLRHQTSGELDDMKLIESITGEKLIYKRRGDQEPEIGSPQEKPKLLRLVVDVSGSMYRFNGHDGRLEREMESLVLVMEALDGYFDKLQFEIVGHSGEDYNIDFSQFDKPPKNNKERLEILKKMYLHSQFCMSGDNTLPATEHAIRTITDQEADEYFVIVLSDANFDRYGILPSTFSALLTSNPKVNAFAIFIGSLGNQAHVLSKQLPAGRAFVCFDSADLPQILQKIFTSALLH
ncbi:von Willebrand factor A domain-containing protein 8-like [Uloborus diversus]|uniref:von Willebrand factor A domain-containing protein 8-like n=1 Tax=Uloborus diversus TaxID=327109 RepID=UPI00240A9304|nr:von Willebrand factor A domain-containing protein 8-like [Uloborus diversus]